MSKRSDQILVTGEGGGESQFSVFDVFVALFFLVRFIRQGFRRINSAGQAALESACFRAQTSGRLGRVARFMQPPLLGAKIVKDFLVNVAQIASSCQAMR